MYFHTCYLNIPIKTRMGRRKGFYETLIYIMYSRLASRMFIPLKVNRINFKQLLGEMNPCPPALTNHPTTRLVPLGQ